MEENEAERDRKIEDPHIDINRVKPYKDRGKKGREDPDIGFVRNEKRGEGQKKIEDFKAEY